MKIAIIVAMEKELRQLLTLLSNPKEENVHGKTCYIGDLDTDRQVIVQQCGLGKVNAAIGAVELINRYQPDMVISTGVAGGATINVPRLHVVASTEVVYHDVYCFTDNEYGQVQGMPPRYTSDKRLVELASTIDHVHTGLIASGDWFVDSKEKAGYILDHFPDALAIDMESGAIAQTCYIYGVPFISFRIISDIPLDNNKAEQYFDFWDKVAQGSFAVLTEFIRKI